MKTLVVNRNIIVSIFAVILLIYGVQSISYGQEYGTPTVTAGETNTSLKVSFIDFLYAYDENAYQIQLRRKSPQGEWITKCLSISLLTGPDNVFSLPHGNYGSSTIFTDLEPGVTYEAHYRDTNLSECTNNPPSPDPWSEIAEGTTHLVPPPRVEFADANLATAVREALGLDTNGDHIELLKIPEAELGKLTRLVLTANNFSDLTPLAQLTQLSTLNLRKNNISDLTPLAQLTQLTTLVLADNNISDLTPLSQLTQLTELDLSENNISDLTPLSQLTQLTELDLGGFDGNNISDLTPLTQLMLLRELDLSNNNVSDVTPLAQLTQLRDLDLSFNLITDVTPLAQLTSLKFLFLISNNVSDLTPLAQLSQRTTIFASHNPVNFKGMPSGIELMTVSTPQPLAEATLNGSSVTLTLLPSGAAYDTSIENIRNALTVSGIDGVTVSDVIRVSDTELKVTFGYTGSLEETTTLIFSLEAEAVSGYEGRALTGAIPVYAELGLTVTSYPLSAATLNGSVITLTLSSGAFEYNRTSIRDALTISGITGITFHRTNIDRVSATVVTIELTFKGDIETDTILTFTLGAGAIADYNGPALTAEIPVSASTDTQTTSSTPEVPNTDSTVSISPSSVASPAIGKQLKLSLNITGGEAVAGYQATVQFDTTALGYVSSTNGDYLPDVAFFVSPVVDGNSVTLNAASLAGESSGDGTLATLTFEVVSVKASTLTLSEVLLVNSAGESFRPQVEEGQITESLQLTGDVNGDGMVNIQDLVLVAGRLGQSGANSADVNGDGTVNIQDLVLVAGALGNTSAAPSLHPHSLEILTAADVKLWLTHAQQLDLTDATSLRGIRFLEQLLAALLPTETTLLPNYPNPFNPETWIPYRLAEDAFVTLTIYDGRGQIVRTLDVGYQSAAFYETRSKAIHWDGRNEFGEGVTSGVYFYYLSAGDFSATRKMLIIK